MSHSSVTRRHKSGLRAHTTAWGWAALWALPWAAPVIAAAPPHPGLNDTGQLRCYAPVWDGPEVPCEGTGQDGDSGRDLSHRMGHDGYAGFSYQKVGASGEFLPPSATEWACVLDRVTGLMWEMKTADGGLHDGLRTYTNLGNGDSGDVSDFMQAVNAAGLCGHQDWRVPSRMELQSIVNYGRAQPMIVLAWFPHTRDWIYWTSTRDVDDIFGGHWTVSFQYGVSVGGGANENQNSARLVRGGRLPRSEHAAARFVAEGDKVTDRRTGLVWRRCAEGAEWNGTTCTGRARMVTWQTALELAQAANHDGAAWRLPNATELFSLVDDSRFSPAINVAIFPGMYGLPIDRFWSSTPRRADGMYLDAYVVDFFSGWLVSDSVDDFYRRVLRLVRVDPP